MSESVAAAFAAASLLALVRCLEMYPRLENETRVFVNNSFIDRAVIGDKKENALKCVTNYSDYGEWYDEEGDVVPRDNSSSFFTTINDSEDHSIISLNKHRNGNNSGVGLFRCEVLDHDGNITNLYIYIGTNKIGSCNLAPMIMSICMCYQPL